MARIAYFSSMSCTRAARSIRTLRVRASFGAANIVAIAGVLLFIAIGLLFGNVPAASQVVDPTLWATNGPVHAIAHDGNTIYVGGDFTYVGLATGEGLVLSAATGQPIQPFPKVSGPSGSYVGAVASDSSGGWYIGGYFDAVGGLPRSNLAHILADGSVAAWSPNPDGPVNALAVTGSFVYVGGQFNTIGGQARHFVAQFDAATGAVTSWDVQADNYVYALAIGRLSAAPAAGDLVYIGGAFHSLAGQKHHFLGLLSKEGGVADFWDPEPDTTVFALATSGDLVYVGGLFTNIAHNTRPHLAKLRGLLATLTSWYPAPDSQVNVMAARGNTIYVGGPFTYIGGGTPRNRLAAVDTTTGDATGWDPSPDSAVAALAVNGSTIYVGGSFTTIGGQARSHIAELDGMTGAATVWDPGLDLDNAVRSVAVGGGVVYIGGSFSMAGRKARKRIAAMDASTGAATGWDPGSDSTVTALAVSGSTIYVGGLFSTIGGQTRNHLAALDATTGAAAAWDPAANSPVTGLTTSGGTIYACGDFLYAGGQDRAGIAALDPLSGAATDWHPGACWQGDPYCCVYGCCDPYTGECLCCDTYCSDTFCPRVNAIVVLDSTVYVGGTFARMGGQTRNNIAALDATSGLATDWNPNANNSVQALTVDEGVIYAGGAFTNIGGQTRNHIAALDPTTGLASAWDPNANNSIQALAVDGGVIYAGGGFTNIGGQARNHIAALDPATSTAMGWDPNANDNVEGMVASGGILLACGRFTTIEGLPVPYLVEVASPTVDVPAVQEARSLALGPITPNPIRSHARVRFTLPFDEVVGLKVYDIAGRQVTSLLDRKVMAAGPHVVDLDTQGWWSGCYFLRLTIHGASRAEKMMVLR